MARRLSGGLALLCVSGAGAFLSRALPVTTQAQPRVMYTHPLEAVSFKDTYDMVISGMNLLVSLSPAVKQGFGVLRENNTAIAVNRLNGSTIALKKALEGAGLVKRECFAEFRDRLDMARKDEQNPCVLVYGPRGCGKTSTVQAAMQGIAGVLCIPYSGNGEGFEERLERALLELGGLEVDGKSVTTGNCLRTILAFYIHVYQCRPIFVIEISSKMEPGDLSGLLLAIKQLGFEEELATFVVVLSASRSALGLTINIRELRVKGYRVRDFNVQEACEYVRRRLEVHHDLAEFVVEQVGTRAMDLVEVCDECRGAGTLDEYQERVGAYRAERIKDGQFALDGFLGIAEENGAAFSQCEGRAFFEALLAGASDLDDRDARMAFGFKKPTALLAALGMHHVFTVDPFSHKVSMQSHFMRIVLSEYLES